ncbi:FBP domain-containing protein [Herbiconiux ginsengi]|nr:FBP domain-containing protein [Herbiconiux ginsengi]
MLPLSDSTIRASFVNATRKELNDLALPTGLDEIDWTKLDYLGWRDRKNPRRAFVVIPVDGSPVGVMLRQAEATPRTRAQCSWCRDVHLPNDVVFFSARRSGAGGRNGNTVGTLVCAEFECSANVRKTPPVAYIGFDVDAARSERIESLRMRAAGFAAEVLQGD